MAISQLTYLGKASNTVSFAVNNQDRDYQLQMSELVDFLSTALAGEDDATLREELADTTDPSKGAGLVGFERSALSGAITTVGQMLSGSAVNIWEYANLITEKPDPFNPASWDWTPAFAMAVQIGGEILCPNSTYIISSVQILNSTRIHCMPGVVFSRKAGTDGPGSSYWINGAAMFELGVPGLTVEIIGTGWTYDGNEASQVAMEPTGFFIKCMPKSTSTSQLPTRVYIRGGRFINHTSGYILLRGDDVNRRYETWATVEDCQFNAGRFGKGRDDPSTQTALGYSPNYILVADYVNLTTVNFRGVWDKPLATGQYSAVAILGTYIGQDFNVSGQCSITMNGKTFIKGVGRGGPGYDGQWTTPLNGIGAIDVYGNGESLYVEDIRALNTRSIPIRAKASIKSYQVVKAFFEDCIGGINCSPSTTGPARAIVSIGQIRALRCTLPVVEITGTSSSDAIPAVTIDNVMCTESLPQENPTLVTPLAPLRLRNITQAVVNSSYSNQSNEYGVSAVSIETLVLRASRVRNAGPIGIHVSDCIDVTIDGFDVGTVTGPGVSILACTGRVTVRRGKTRNTVDYGIFNNSTAAIEATIENNNVAEVTGLSRGIYSASVDTEMRDNRTGSNVSTPVLVAATVRNDATGNSWQPSVFFGGATPPTSNPWRRGDVVRNQFATGVAGSPREHVCTVAGTPGTWVTVNF